MRTTLTIDDELFVAAKKIAASSSSSLSQVVNDYLRLGLSTCSKPPRITPFRMITFRGEGARAISTTQIAEFRDTDLPAL
jgi:hypothetical protein